MESGIDLLPADDNTIDCAGNQLYRSESCTAVGHNGHMPLADESNQGWHMPFPPLIMPLMKF